MDKSFTSLTYKKGPSRQECCQFISTFKSVVLSNAEIEQNKIESKQNKMNRDKIQDERAKINRDETQMRQEIRNEKNSLTRQDKRDPVSGYRITIGNDYVIRINAVENKRPKRSVNSTLVNSEQSNQGRTKNLEDSQHAPIEEKAVQEHAKTNETSSLSTSTNDYNHKGNQALNESDDAKLDKLYSDTTMIMLHTKSKDSSEKTSAMDNCQNEIQVGSDCSQELNIVDLAQSNVNNYDSTRRKYSNKSQDSSPSKYDKHVGSVLIEIERPNPIQIEPTVQTILSKKSSAEMLVQGKPAAIQEEFPIQEFNQESPKMVEPPEENSAIQTKSSVESTLQKMSTILETILAKSAVKVKQEAFDDKNDRTSSRSLENPNLQTSAATLSRMKKELDAWLKVDKLPGVSLDSLDRVLSNVLEKISVGNMIHTDSQDSCDSTNSGDENMLIMSTNYYIVNIKQIKSIAEILDRINRVVSKLIKYSIREQEASSKCQSEVSKDTGALESNASLPSDIENANESWSKTETNSGTTIENDYTIENKTDNRDKAELIVHHANIISGQGFGTLRTNRSMPTEFAYSSDDCQPESVHADSVLVDDFLTDGLPSSDKAYSSTNSCPNQLESTQTESVLVNTYLAESSASNTEIACSAAPQMYETRVLHNPLVYNYYNSLGSQTSETDIQSETIGSQGELCQNDFISLGSQTSESDIQARETPRRRLGRTEELFETGRESYGERELSQQGGEKERIRQRSRFRSAMKRKTSKDPARTTNELLALLDDVEKLLINNCADRYEMMILLEQIFSDYSESAAKAVVDLRKFIVTFNKNNSYL